MYRPYSTRRAPGATGGVALALIAVLAAVVLYLLNEKFDLMEQLTSQFVDDDSDSEGGADDAEGADGDGAGDTAACRFSAWSKCSDGTQTRTVVKGCVGIEAMPLSRACDPAPLRDDGAPFLEPADVDSPAAPAPPPAAPTPAAPTPAAPTPAAPPPAAPAKAAVTSEKESTPLTLAPPTPSPPASAPPQSDPLAKPATESAPPLPTSLPPALSDGPSASAAPLTSPSAAASSPDMPPPTAIAVHSTAAGNCFYSDWSSCDMDLCEMTRTLNSGPPEKCTDLTAECTDCD